MCALVCDWWGGSSWMQRIKCSTYSASERKKYSTIRSYVFYAAYASYLHGWCIGRPVSHNLGFGETCWLHTDNGYYVHSVFCSQASSSTYIGRLAHSIASPTFTALCCYNVIINITRKYLPWPGMWRMKYLTSRIKHNKTELVIKL